MKSSFLIMDSYTAARRAAVYLKSLRINAEVEKKTSKGGCSYGVRIYDSPEKACRLLSAAGMECRKVVEG